MRHIHKIFSLSLFIGIASCAANSEYLTVASQKADCMGVGPQKCLQVKESNASDWTFLYQGIEGFNYEEGFEYVLKIKKEKIQNPPADASSIKYILVKEVSKTSKK